MAVRTISNAGGNWNATASWVEGVVPTSADNVVATSTSGNLTVTAAANVGAIDFNNYVSTFTINSGQSLVVSGAGGNFATFYGTASYAGTGIISLGSNVVINGNNTDISPITLSLANTPIQINSNITVQTLQSPRAATTQVNQGTGGPFKFGVKGDLITPSSGLGLWLRNGTIEFLGTGTQSVGRNGGTTDNAMVATANFIFNHTGTVVFNRVYMGTSDTPVNAGFVNNGLTYIQGNITGTKDIRIQSSAITNVNNSTTTLNLGTSSGWNLDLNYTGVSVMRQDLLLLSDFNFNNITTAYRSVPISSVTNNIIRITGPGALRGGRIILENSKIITTTNLDYGTLDGTFRLQFGNTASHLVEQLVSSGGEFNGVISSQTASTTAFLGITATSSIMRTTITDIDASAAPFDVYQCSLTRTNSITNYDTLGGGGVAGGSFTFVN